ncbi:hypothetical protein ElyMa_004913800 [Elysia marginata]|uniref:Uncharacterized protein n=1 Tax=Elysia marginata TaxID=1093978 RepID=A0AAV4IX44_9GAST|nr:hypothetical protein ElyMa_004913800 [Elysia marginata]
MSSAEPSKVFMVMCVDDAVMENQAQSMKDTCIWNALKLSNMLEQQGVFTRVLYPGCGVIMGDSKKAG